MHDHYLAHVALIAPPESGRGPLDITYDEVCAAAERAQRAWILDVWRRHHIGRTYAAFAQVARVASTPPGEPLPVHEDPEVERLSYLLTPPALEAELVAELVARGYPAAEAARVVEDAACAAQGKPLPDRESRLPQVGTFYGD